MYAGKLAEWADVRGLFGKPRHPYTQGLLGSMPRLAGTSRPAADHSRHGAEPARAAARLPVRRPLPARARALPRGLPAARRHGRPRLRLLEPRPVSGPPGADPRGPGPGQAFSGQGRADLCRERRELLPGTRRDHRHRRGIRLRQVDARAHRAAPDRADQRPAAVRRRGPAASAAKSPAPAPARHADHLSGPLRLARSARADRHEHRGAAAHPWLRQPGRARAPVSPSCSSWSASAPRPPRAIRTSSPAASASASASPGRSPPAPSW